MHVSSQRSVQRLRVGVRMPLAHHLRWSFQLSSLKWTNSKIAVRHWLLNLVHHWLGCWDEKLREKMSVDKRINAAERVTSKYLGKKRATAAVRRVFAIKAELAQIKISNAWLADVAYYSKTSGKDALLKLRSWRERLDRSVENALLVTCKLCEQLWENFSKTRLVHMTTTNWTKDNWNR